MAMYNHSNKTSLPTWFKLSSGDGGDSISSILLCNR